MTTDRNSGNIIKFRKTTGICLLLVLLLCTAMLSGCKGKTVEIAQPVVGKEKLKLYVTDMSSIKSIQYESFSKSYIVMGMPMGMGPSDPGYRGIIHLSEETGKEIFDNYKWAEDPSPLPTFVNIDTTPLNSDTWYVSEDPDYAFFDYAMCRVTDFRFNGKNTIIFSIQTF